MADRHRWLWGVLLTLKRCLPGALHWRGSIELGRRGSGVGEARAQHLITAEDEDVLGVPALLVRERAKEHPMVSGAPAVAMLLDDPSEP